MEVGAADEEDGADTEDGVVVVGRADRPTSS